MFTRQNQRGVGRETTQRQRNMKKYLSFAGSLPRYLQSYGWVRTPKMRDRNPSHHPLFSKHLSGKPNQKYGAGRNGMETDVGCKCLRQQINWLQLAPPQHSPKQFPYVLHRYWNDHVVCRGCWLLTLGPDSETLHTNIDSKFLPHNCNRETCQICTLLSLL